jgi:hypothetical protein
MMCSEAVEFHLSRLFQRRARQLMSPVLCAELRAALDRDRDHNLPFELRHLVEANTGKCPESL